MFSNDSSHVMPSFSLMTLFAIGTVSLGLLFIADGQAAEETPVIELLTTEATWQAMPATISGGGGPLPVWALAVARELPRTAAAMLPLDYAQRTQSPLDPKLRAKLRWIVARENRCDYAMAYALFDLREAGATEAEVRTLLEGPAAWPEADREPGEFVRQLTVSASQIPDELFARLRERFGDKGVAAMVLLAAYGNFQDRIVLGLQLPMEPNGPLPPVNVQFVEEAFQLAPFVPEPGTPEPLDPTRPRVVPVDVEWGSLTYDDLQARLERQRDRAPRLPIPDWEAVKPGLPPAMATRPTRIVWNLVCSGYVPELAVPWSIATRTMWAEARGDRVFEESLFWVQTRAIECNYCMGHCEMLLEVAGLDQRAVAERTRLLSQADWSAFPPNEQRAYTYAKRLTRTPWELTPSAYHQLERDLGSKSAMATFWWLCRGLYMTRVSDGFQLPLERENVFQPLSVKSGS